MQISGTIRIGEANAASRKVAARVRGNIYWINLLVAIALGVGGVILADMLEQTVKVDIGIPYWIGGLIVVIPVAVLLSRKFTVWAYRRRLTRKGLRLDMPVQMTLARDCLSYQLADVRKRAGWSAVSELFFAKGYWIFLVQGTPVFAPRRLFDGEDAERGFVAQALGYMSEEARARSRAAVTFAAAGGAAVNGFAGTIRIGEANAACGRIGARQRGPAYQLWLLLAGFVIAGTVLALGLDLLVHWRVQLVNFGPMLGAVAYLFAGRRVLQWRFRNRLVDKGTPLDMPTSMAIAPDGISYSLAEVSYHAEWTAVSELFLAKGYWVFLVQSGAWYAPRRLFADKAGERAFLREVLSHMSEAARARSGQAVKFVERNAA